MFGYCLFIFNYLSAAEKRFKKTVYLVTVHVRLCLFKNCLFSIQYMNGCVCLKTAYLVTVHERLCVFPFSIP